MNTEHVPQLFVTGCAQKALRGEGRMGAGLTRQSILMRRKWTGGNGRLSCPRATGGVWINFIETRSRGHFDLRVVDVCRRPERVEHQFDAAPALIGVSPPPTWCMAANVLDSSRVLAGL
jgi:hypothetical protein